MLKCHNGQTMTKRGSLNKKLDAAAWGLFFIWTGIAFLADVGWGAGLLGVGIITLGAQVARRYSGLWSDSSLWWAGFGSCFGCRLDLCPSYASLQGSPFWSLYLLAGQEIQNYQIDAKGLVLK
ncbi:MAG: hypothetical protein OEW45_01330 [Deltaproteobacteria bacterium]|nr:hypothetical protein [Deltaproteobacteria bacterium]